MKSKTSLNEKRNDESSCIGQLDQSDRMVKWSATPVKRLEGSESCSAPAAQLTTTKCETSKWSSTGQSASSQFCNVTSQDHVSGQARCGLTSTPLFQYAYQQKLASLGSGQLGRKEGYSDIANMRTCIEMDLSLKQKNIEKYKILAFFIYISLSGQQALRAGTTDH